MKPADLRAGIAEIDLQTMIVARAQARGWLVHHDRGDVRVTTAGDPGFPDLVLARGGQVIFAELKRARGRVSPSQALWLDHLDGLVLHETYVWRPDDWPRIQEVLDRP